MTPLSTENVHWRCWNGPYHPVLNMPLSNLERYCIAKEQHEKAGLYRNRLQAIVEHLEAAQVAQDHSKKALKCEVDGSEAVLDKDLSRGTERDGRGPHTKSIV